MENKESMNTDRWVEEQIGGLEPAANWQPNAANARARLRQRQQQGAAPRRVMKWGAAAACVASVALLTFPTTRAATYRLCLDACAAVWPALAVASEGAIVIGAPEQSLSRSPSSSAPSQGFRSRPDGLAPDFTLPAADGHPIRLSDFRGKVVLLNFWATWCGPCKIEMPWFVEFQREYRDRGFAVVAVSLDEEGWQAVKPFIEDLKPNFPIVVGSDELAESFGGIAALPTTFLIDREGKIRHQHTGLAGADEYEEEIKELLELR
jgi:cytochrome c biogenesis protein CcmG/thiol:disulfide interchange protein DsbE